MEFTGLAQTNRDSVDAIVSRLPLVLGLIAAIMLVLLFPFYWMAITTVRPDSELYRPWNAANSRRGMIRP